MNKGRKKTGGKYIKNRKKKLNEISGQKTATKIGETKKGIKKKVGGKKKKFLLKTNIVNVKNKDKKISKAEIKNVLETPSNRFLARQNILTKGAIVETEIGKVRITNRPTQEGNINGILIE